MLAHALGHFLVRFATCLFLIASRLLSNEPCANWALSITMCATSCPTYATSVTMLLQRLLPSYFCPSAPSHALHQLTHLRRV
jgi:hypothetical protein